jgi:thioredoxin reductase (NADPH)
MSADGGEACELTRVGAGGHFLRCSRDGRDVIFRCPTCGGKGQTMRVPVGGDDPQRLLGKGIYFGAARSDAGAANGLDLYFIGAGNSAGQAAIHFASYARTLTLIVRGDSLEKSMSHYLIEQLREKSNIAVQLSSEVQAVHGDTHLTAIDIRDATTAVQRQDCDGLFVFIGADAETAWLPSEIARDARGYVLTGDDAVKAGRWTRDRDPYLFETSVPGVFACGDVRASKVKRVASAVGEGSMAIALVHQYLQHAFS